MTDSATVKLIVDEYLTLADDSCVAILPDVLRITTELGIAQIIGDRCLHVATIAELAGCHPSSLRRLLRGLGALGVTSESSPDHFSLTATGRRLLPDGPHSVAASISNPESSVAWLLAAETIRTGRPAYDLANQDSFFAHKNADDASQRAFLQRMRERAARLYTDLVSRVDWETSKVVMDAGGGDGYMLAQILHAKPHLKGILFDRPATTAYVDAEQPHGLVEIPLRWQAHGGDLFDRFPMGADTHLMCSVLHDWPDPEVVTILRNSRDAIPAHGRLFIVEMILPDDARSHPSVWSDLGMLVLTGGQERTRTEFAKLFAASGFALRSEIPMADSPFSILEVRPV